MSRRAEVMESPGSQSKHALGGVSSSALMAALVLVGMMGLAWVVGLAALVAVEKLAPRGLVWARVTGVAFLLAAIFEGVR